MLTNCLGTMAKSVPHIIIKESFSCTHTTVLISHGSNVTGKKSMTEKFLHGLVNKEVYP